MTYTSHEFRELFQAPFDLEQWKDVLSGLFQIDLRLHPEPIDTPDSVMQGYYLGRCTTADHYALGAFYYRLPASIDRRRVSLRQLVRTFINPTFGQLDCAIAVFDDGHHWRLSFISDIQGEATAPKRYTFLFGDPDGAYNTPVGRFIDLQAKGPTYENIKDAFSVEALTRQFYNDLFDWYQWAIDEHSGITFPNNTAIEDDDREDIDIKIIRLITRLMFVWFIKQKGLVPEKLFQTDFLQTILRDFRPNDTQDGTYYNAILQNLFFATLNRAIEDEDHHRRGFAKRTSTRDVKTLYRYAEMFSITEDEVVSLFACVPFLNGGLFECLDKCKLLDGVERAYNYDGFSRNDARFTDGRYKYRAVVPNALFFAPERGLFHILRRYNFTIEENTPNEQTVALDPELLGKVFENLLGAYNPETKETARKDSGSFYTPREIVGYMVDESLLAYLKHSPLARKLIADDDYMPTAEEAEEAKTLAQKLRAVKCLDPACGSGAFPMGLLNRLSDLLGRLEPTDDNYNRKLHIIENCLYGSDIQSIAAQITKLRFFIALICDCQRDPDKPNYGMPTLPNLETKFVAANSLIAKKKRSIVLDLFENDDIEPTKQKLAQVRHQHFGAKSAYEKTKLRKQDEELRGNLATLLEDENNIGRDDARQLAEWNPYDQNATADFFDPDWMFGLNTGFDIVIGNPPYIQLQNNGGALARLYQNCGYTTLKSTGDIYCLFYERGLQLLRAGGHLCYITSNKWMRAGYGEALRKYFAAETDPQLLIDFAGVKVFESATVDVNILLLAKQQNHLHTSCVTIPKDTKKGIDLSRYVREHSTPSAFNDGNSWVMLSPIEQSIKQKIEAVGTPLKDWDIQINYGIKTGCNEAFIISTEKRDEILNACADEDERKRTAEIIRPILRGRDIKRYKYDWKGLWLINTHNGIRHRIPRIRIENYPAIKAHLDQYWDKIQTRADQGDTPYNLRNCAYMEDFQRPRIFYADITQQMDFCLCEEPMFCNNTTYFISSDDSTFLKKLCGYLNTKLVDWYYRTLSVQLGEKAVRMFNIYVMEIPVPRDLSGDIYKTFHFSPDEIAFIENHGN